MGQAHEDITHNLAEQLCRELACRNDCQVVRPLDHKQHVDGVFRLDEGVVLDNSSHFPDQVSGMALLAEIHGMTSQREMLPFVPYVLPYGLKILFGLATINALPVSLFSHEALIPLVNFHAQHVRHEVCQRSAATRQGERALGPICPDTAVTSAPSTAESRAGGTGAGGLHPAHVRAGLLWDLSSHRIFAAGGREAQRSAVRHRHQPGQSREIRVRIT